MSNVARVAGQAANTLTKPLEVEEVFSTYLYYPTGNTHTVTNGIDLSGEGGLVWLKNRLTSSNHELADTERGVTKKLSSNSSSAEDSLGDLSAFNSDGFSLSANNGNAVYNTAEVASWTFRKAPKFFDVVTYTGNGGNLTIDHNLGSVPGCIIIKCTSAVKSWAVYHRGVNGGSNPENYALFLNSTSAQNDNLYFQDTAPTSTQFFLGDSVANENGQTHVAYLFAHNNNDGGFGPDGDADAIKCGSYTGGGSSSVAVDLGWEPQWLLLKNSSGSGNWHLLDNMRPWSVNSTAYAAPLYPNLSDQEYAPGVGGPKITSTGFVTYGGNGWSDIGDIIYIAIRRPTAVPTSATEVFDVQTSTSANFVHTTGFDVDLAITGSQDGWARNAGVVDRLRGDGKSLETSNTDAESAGNAGVHEFDRSREYLNSSTSGDQVAWAWKRAPKYMDVVAYTGNGTAGHTVSHNLTVAPEMMWVKRRNGVSSWITYWEPLGATKGVFIDTNAAFTSATYWNDTAPTDSVFTLGNGSTNTSSATFIAYLFATLANISKVGSFSHTNGTNSVVDCGFTSGARFVLLKRTDSADNWDLWDSARGINTGTEPKLVLNTTSNESVTDEIDPDGSGFIYASGGNTGDYIFYAIA